MPKTSSPRRGSLQYWPRKRARKLLPSVNWKAISSSDKGLMGFICYKAGMKSAIVKDMTEHSMTKNKKISLPVTILEAPPIKIFSVRFYKQGIVSSEVLNPNVDKELQRKLKLPKDYKKKIEDVKDYDDVRVIVYSQAKKTRVKKTPDIAEVALSGSLDEKINFVRENLNREISIKEIFKIGELVDVRGVTKGKGFQGPVKRFGIKLRQHKSEKGVRKVGSIGPWHPAFLMYTVPMAGQLGMFTRVIYNLKIINFSEEEMEIMNYGKIKNYILIRGSVPGAKKRQILITKALRPRKEQERKKFELLELR